MEKETYHYANSTATRMLAAGIERVNQEQGLSIRQLGKQIGYKQAVVLSHMALGRVPIPIDRAQDLAKALDLDQADFLRAVVNQRYPDVNWNLLSTRSQSGDDQLPHELEVILGTKLENLSQEQRRVMREVAIDRYPSRRWLSVHEMAAVECLRKLRPAIVSEGLNSTDMQRIIQVLQEKED